MLPAVRTPSTARVVISTTPTAGLSTPTNRARYARDICGIAPAIWIWRLGRNARHALEDAPQILGTPYNFRDLLNVFVHYQLNWPDGRLAPRALFASGRAAGRGVW